VQRLHRLGHDAVIGSDHQDRDVGDVGTPGTHGGERIVTGGVDGGDRTFGVLVLGTGLVGTDVLGDTTGFPTDDVGAADGIEQPGLTVVDGTHDGHHRCTGLPVLVGLLRLF